MPVCTTNKPVDFYSRTNSQGGLESFRDLRMSYNDTDLLIRAIVPMQGIVSAGMTTVSEHRR